MSGRRVSRRSWRDGFAGGLLDRIVEGVGNAGLDIEP
jgi:hypothetical protein